MTTCTFTGKTGDVWTWEETPEVIAALEEYRRFAGNYPGPLYAPHPHIKNETSSDTKTNDVG